MRRGAGALVASAYFAVVFGVTLSLADRFVASRWSPLPAQVVFLVLVMPGLLLLVYRDLRGRSSGVGLGRLLGSARPVLVPFYVLMVVSLAQALRPQANWADLGQYVFAVPYAMVVFLTGLVFTESALLRRSARRFPTVALVVLGGSILVDLAAPGFFSKQVSRAAGLAENANAAAFLMIMLSSLVIEPDRARTRDLGILGITGIAVFATLSRSGILLYLVLLCAYAVTSGRLRRLTFRRVAALAAGTVVVSAAVALAIRFLLRRSVMFEAATARRRLAMLSGESGMEIGSDGRVRVLYEFLSRIEESPVLGYGTGYGNTFSIAPHNTYILQWLDLGIVGLLAYCAMLAGALLLFVRRGSKNGVFFIVVLTLFGVFSHNVLELRPVLLAWGFLVGTTARATVREAPVGAPDPVAVATARPRTRLV